MSDRLITEKRRADALRRTAPEPEAAYWLGYRLGLTTQHEHHDAILTGIGSEDAGRDARGRGYRDGRQWVGDAEARSAAAATLGRRTTPAKARAARRNGTLGGRPRRRPPS